MIIISSYTTQIIFVYLIRRVEKKEVKVWMNDALVRSIQHYAFDVS